MFFFEMGCSNTMGFHGQNRSPWASSISWGESETGQVMSHAALAKFVDVNDTLQ